MATSWLELVSAAFTGGIVVKLLDIVYSEYKQKKTKSTSAKYLLDRNIDPILKSADELLSKLFSLAREDFKSLYEEVDEVQVGYVVFLFAHFWSRFAILRRESVHEQLVAQKHGHMLLKFIATFEARKNRFLNRALQRGIGDSIVEYKQGNLKSKPFSSFFEEYSKNDSSIRTWVEPLREILMSTSKKDIRQRVLFYGVILHAFVDTFDPKHKYTSDRITYPNKLTEARRRDLRYRLFRRYLPMVKNSEKYWRIKEKDK